eukprot:CAMPEP_0204840814 /NCGR_PEP_ID=MMETSP1346-20131115/39114_1 /ASSEMBLY_ACC=CAM_ASM_000771 /TAXON_ID=215587 /ORGANISM="Aplanochytrium stocchinoi, Strain GSBS06" /LENGTH=35 /DNA_ID= /DNA_START= /DNA_END= /DNA_ORIENTATION=
MTYKAGSKLNNLTTAPLSRSPGNFIFLVLVVAAIN